MKRIEFTLDQQLEICNLYNEKNIGLINIGLKFNVSRTTIQRVLLENGILIKNMSDSHKGQNPWNKGKKWSDEIKQKISNKSKNRFGNQNPNWKGGIASKSDKRRNLKIVKQWRLKCLERDNETCIWCKSKEKVEVNHIIPLREIKDINLLGELDNGITLCRKCHNKIHYHEHEYIDIFRNLLKNRVNSGNIPLGQS